MYTVGLKKRDFKRCMCTCGTLHCHFWVCFYILQYIPTGNFSRLSYVIHVYLLKMIYLYFIYGLPLLNWCFLTIFWRYSSIQPTILITSHPPPPPFLPHNSLSVPHQLQCIGREMRLKAKIQKYENVQKKPSLASHVTSSLFKAFNKTSTRQVITKVLKYRMLVFQSFWYWRTLRLKFINKHFLDCLYNKIMQFLTKNYLLPGR